MRHRPQASLVRGLSMAPVQCTPAKRQYPALGLVHVRLAWHLWCLYCLDARLSAAASILCNQQETEFNLTNKTRQCTRTHIRILQIQCSGSPQNDQLASLGTINRNAGESTTYTCTGTARIGGGYSNIQMNRVLCQDTGTWATERVPHYRGISDCVRFGS